MANLGSFGAAVREADPRAEKDTFEFCGEQFEVKGKLPPMLMVQLGAATTGKIDEQEGLGAIWEAMRCSLTEPERQVDGETIPADPAAFLRFYRLAVERCVELDDLIALAMALFEAQAGRPTAQRPDSQPGSLPTSTSSSGSSSTHPALAHLRPVSQVLAG
ncbi:hypothetical protein [Micromonospora peucetia]|uniref:Uncharacterized protein n=1 Tax=Micromonospora peucetia TaxID=47871 RepID=A0ABZ1EJY2_9ACTN|nr:hypothetical protein [Micromonospora peucetia]WSA34551.1 hypothetical protein OIE14_11155 [Micromonospora peucetia]